VNTVHTLGEVDNTYATLLSIYVPNLMGIC